MYNYLVRAKELEGQILADRRHLHQIPELGDHLPQTSAYVIKRLTEMGYAPTRCAESGVVATVGRGEPVFLLRADMDALPMPEESGLPFASPHADKAHTCGHDTHVAMLLTAAQMLKENEATLKGTVKLMFEPGEETLYGALNMIADGVLKNPAPRAAMAIHVDATMPKGRLMAGKGNAFASNDFFDIAIQGKGSHAARPADAVDPINVAAHIQVALQSLISREALPTETNVISITAIHTAGESYNVIPETVAMKGTLRTYNQGQRDLLKRRLVELTTGVAAAFGATAGLTFLGEGTPALVCDLALADQLIRGAEKTLGAGSVYPHPFLKVGSEDIANLSLHIPVGYFFLGAGLDENTPYPFGQHHPKVVINEEVLPTGAALLAGAASEWLAEQGTL